MASSSWVKGLFVTVVSIIAGTLLGQTHVSVYPQQTGNNLLLDVQSGFKPTRALNYDNARDEMFGKIWKIQDSVRSIYSGFTIRMSTGVDPSRDAFSKGLNTEHVYPQSKGASSGNAKADLHHLMPCKADINTDRSSLPFGEINDAQTRRWYRKSQILTSKPRVNIDDYSEWNGRSFEPRESKKGDIARAVFYFWTIYRTQAQSNDADFFDEQKDVLCDWITKDEVDLEEFRRTLSIEKYQGNANPFILDCTLAKRLGYCNQVTSACNALVSTNDAVYSLEKARVFPNPIYDRFSISSESESLWRMYDIYGRLVMDNLQPGKVISVDGFQSGLYILTNESNTDRIKVVIEH